MLIISFAYFVYTDEQTVLLYSIRAGKGTGRQGTGTGYWSSKRGWEAALLAVGAVGLHSKMMND
mgnify:CR=1 FL=1